MLGHTAAALDFLVMDRACVRSRGVLAHPVERPPEVDGCRPGASQDAIGFFEVLAKLRRERVAVRRRDPDGRRATDGERADRVRHLGGIAALELDFLARQPPLVEEDDAVCLQPDDAVRGQ
jgi:hypothetical protein